MHIIIDGYNVLKQVIQKPQITSQERHAFISKLARYAKLKGHTISIVFDGGPGIWPVQEKSHGVVIVYAGTKYTADDYIMKLMQEKKNLLIVSSDTQIKMQALKMNFSILDSREFYELLLLAIKKENVTKDKNLLIKTTPQKNDLLDELMRVGSQKIEKKDDAMTESRQTKKYTLSKKERKFVQKLKKL